MKSIKPLQPPSNIQWQHWVERWDKMQERYLVRRAERIELLVGLVRGVVSPVERVLDLGCGTGSLMQPFLDAFPDAEVYGVDFDPVLLPLAQERLRTYGARARLVLADLRTDAWRAQLPGLVDAAISSTALHWLTEAQLSNLYRQLSSVVRSRGLFVSADHVASRRQDVQKFWEQNREQMRRVETKQDGEDWEGFWEAYTQALGLSGQRRVTERVLGGWDGGVEEGLPLEWHFAELTASGFSHPECFWRCDCDAIYGAFR
ncbi:MAG TPA: class I SAM-dependent methyltransferase [Verrucomicrobiae bacterium]|nr:class I SAM-dependent methyltransferase [Verrucomicrobiae bacterium]